MAELTQCPSCDSTDLRAFHEQRGIPVNSCLLLDDADEAKQFPRGDLLLKCCRNCGFIFNALFTPDVSEYSERYEETQGFSPRFRVFAEELAQRWIDKYDLHDRTIVEVGCGKGEFLVTMCELGPNRGIGIDPSYRPERTQSEAADRIEFIRDFYGEPYSHLKGDALVCRHTLEHISPVGEFMRTIRRTVGDDPSTVVLFELPDVSRVLTEIGFWDIYYEHCTYFTLGSLARLFRRTGFDVIGLDTEFDDQYLTIEARPGSGDGTPLLPGEDDLEVTMKSVDFFEETFPGRIQEWRDQIDGIVDAGRRAVVWGGGSKGVAYLNTLGLTDEIELVVDINPYKQGKFMAGTGQQVVGPEALVEHRPDVVLLMNPIYHAEIEGTLAGLGISCEVVDV